MATVRLSKRTVDAAAPQANRYTLFDEDVTGFGLRVFPSGQKSYVIEYRAGEAVAGRPRSGSLSAAQRRSRPTRPAMPRPRCWRA